MNVKTAFDSRQKAQNSQKEPLPIGNDTPSQGECRQWSKLFILCAFCAFLRLNCRFEVQGYSRLSYFTGFSRSTVKELPGKTRFNPPPLN